MHNMPGLPVGQFALRPGPAAGRERPRLHRRHGQGRPRRAAARVHRHRAGRLPHRHRAADRSCRATSIPSTAGRHLDLHAARGRGRQRDPARRRSSRAPPARSTPQVRDLIERRIVEVAETTAELHGATRQGHLRAQLPRDHQPRARRPSSPRGSPRRSPAPTRSTPTSPRDGRRGLLVHAGGAPRRLHLHRQRRHRRRAPSPIRLQRRRHPVRHLLLGAPRRDGHAGVAASPRQRHAEHGFAMTRGSG